MLTKQFSIYFIPSLCRLLLAGAFLLLAACGRTSGHSQLADAWNGKNDPMIFSGKYDYLFERLPLKGQLEKMPWSDAYWPSSKGGIARRWQAAVGAPDAWSYDLPSKIKLGTMSEQEISQLSPAEKFDIFRNELNFPLVHSERYRVSSLARSWEGICHGWAAASLVFAEPKPIVIAGANGINVSFGAADIKALLDYYMTISGSTFTMLAERCNIDLSAHPESANDPKCRDTNAGAFHVVLANEIGTLKNGFVADVTRDAEVWNQPVHSFETEILAEQGPSYGAAAGTVRELIVETEMTYTAETEPHWEATNGTLGHNERTKIYQYRLELDGAGSIIGGEWQSDSRPDFLWTQALPDFSYEFFPLKLLYEASIK